MEKGATISQSGALQEGEPAAGGEEHNEKGWPSVTALKKKIIKGGMAGDLYGPGGHITHIRRVADWREYGATLLYRGVVYSSGGRCRYNKAIWTYKRRGGQNQRRESRHPHCFVVSRVK